MKFACPFCDYEHSSSTSFLRHCKRTHDKTPEDVYVQLHCNGVHPVCSCGCGEKLKYRGFTQGFLTYVSGHHQRVQNNWGHNESVQEKSQETRRKMHKEGKIKIWNKGGTKETDERIKAYGEKCSLTLQENNDELIKRSERMHHNRLSGIIPTLSGSSHSQWKGGTSALQAHVRSHVLNFWSRPIMQRDGFTCKSCGAQSDLCVHHSGERFATILKKAIDEIGEYIESADDSFVIKEKITKWVVAYHIDNDIPGVTLCRPCHDLVHSSKSS